MTDDARDTRDIPGDAPAPAILTDDDADAAGLAREAWRASGGTLSGAELGRRYPRADGTPRSERWGRKQIAEARGTGNGTPGGTEAARPRVNGTRQAARPAVPQRRAPARGTEPERAPASLVAVTVLSVAVVLAVCAVVSYSHIRHLAEVTGSGHAALLPLALDGMVAACSCSLLVDRHRGTDGSRVARLGLVIGLASTLAANAVAVDAALVSPRAVTLALALYPPSALAVTGHLALRMLGDR